MNDHNACCLKSANPITMAHINVDPSAVCDALVNVGLRGGDVLLLHSDAIVAAQFPPMPTHQRLDKIIDAVRDVLGPKGTLVMPAFSYSFTRGETYDVLKTPSRVGMLSERFRTRAGVQRTMDPIFSLAVEGALACEIVSASVRECFGPDSAFALLHRENALIVDLGCSPTRGGTFIHYVERAHAVDYRYNKTFSGEIKRADGTLIQASVIYYVRDLARRSSDNLARFQRCMEDLELMHRSAVGRFPVLGARANDWFNTAWQMLDEDPVSLIEEGIEPLRHAACAD